MNYEIEKLMYGDELRVAINNIKPDYIRNHLLRFFDQMGEEALNGHYLTFGEFLFSKCIRLESYLS